jgi:hypothetical protein
MIPVLAHSDKPSVDDVPSPWWSERILALSRLGRPRRLNNPSRDFDTSPDVIRMFVMTHVRFPLSLRKLKMASPRSSRLVDRFGTTRPFAVSTARVDVKPPVAENQECPTELVAGRAQDRDSWFLVCSSDVAIGEVSKPFVPLF